MKTFHLDIKVTVTGHTDANLLAPLVNDAMQELVNRADFRHGRIRQGRVLTHEHDHGEIKVTVDLMRQREDTDAT
jgi:hypothetical protein